MGKYIIDWVKEEDNFSKIMIVYQHDNGTIDPPRDDCKEFFSIKEIIDKLEELNYETHKIKEEKHTLKENNAGVLYEKQFNNSKGK